MVGKNPTNGTKAGARPRLGRRGLKAGARRRLIIKLLKSANQRIQEHVVCNEQNEVDIVAEKALPLSVHASS